MPHDGQCDSSGAMCSCPQLPQVIEPARSASSSDCEPRRSIGAPGSLGALGWLKPSDGDLRSNGDDERVGDDGEPGGDERVDDESD